MDILPTACEVNQALQMNPGAMGLLTALIQVWGMSYLLSKLVEDED